MASWGARSAGCYVGRPTRDTWHRGRQEALAATLEGRPGIHGIVGGKKRWLLRWMADQGYMASWGARSAGCYVGWLTRDTWHRGGQEALAATLEGRPGIHGIVGGKKRWLLRWKADQGYMASWGARSAGCYVGRPTRDTWHRGRQEALAATLEGRPGIHDIVGGKKRWLLRWKADQGYMASWGARSAGCYVGRPTRDTWHRGGQEALAATL